MNFSFLNCLSEIPFIEKLANWKQFVIPLPFHFTKFYCSSIKLAIIHNTNLTIVVLDDS